MCVCVCRDRGQKKENLKKLKNAKFNAALAIHFGVADVLFSQNYVASPFFSFLGQTNGSKYPIPLTARSGVCDDFISCF